jgi:hypothetical protein
MMESTAMKPLKLLVSALLAAGLSTAVLAQALRPEVAKPLQQASDLLKAGKAREALAKVNEADAVGGKSGPEQYLINRMRGSAAQRTGDHGAAARAFEAAYPSAPGGEKGQLAESIAFAYSQLRDNAKTTQWIQAAQQNGNNSSSLRQLQAYMQSQSGDYSAILQQSSAAVAAAEKAGQRPGEDDLLRMADAAQRMNNSAQQVSALEKLVAHYPKKEYWAALLGRLQRKPEFSDRFALDVMRLRLATGNLAKTEEFMEMAQLALQAKLPAEGKRIVEKGYELGALGTGPEASRHQRLRDLAVKQEAEQRAAIAGDATQAASAKDGNDLVQVGVEYAGFGEFDKGITLIQQGINKGGLKRPEDAKLRLGQAQLASGKARAAAVQMLKSVQGKDGAADIARLSISAMPQ